MQAGSRFAADCASGIVASASALTSVSLDGAIDWLTRRRKKGETARVAWYAIRGMNTGCALQLLVTKYPGRNHDLQRERRRRRY